MNAAGASGAIRDAVSTFLSSLTEREFDGPLLAALSAQGCWDIHFMHGSFEFGKDVIAKRRDPYSGEVQQLAIQSKAGDVGMAGWRDVRPQLEECEYNTVAHPAFDPALDRVAVLVVTGRLKGGAQADSQAFGSSVRARGLAQFEVWDGETLLDWFCNDPSLGLGGRLAEPELLELLVEVEKRTITESRLERYTRAWLQAAGGFPVACLEAAILSNALRRENRLDLAALVALHLLRCAQATDGPSTTQTADRARRTALRLFEGQAQELLLSAQPALADPAALARAAVTLGGLASYPATCCRLLEIFAALGLTTNDTQTRDAALAAVTSLISDHPGARRPPSDAFAVSLVPVVALLAPVERRLVLSYMRSVATWMLDRHDDDHRGLGIGSLDEVETTAVARLLGGALTSVTIDKRDSSLLACVVLDLLALLEVQDLYDAVRANIEALRIVPTISIADENRAVWRRGGLGIWPQPRVEHGNLDGPRPLHWNSSPGSAPVVGILLTLVARSRHYPDLARRLIDNAEHAG